MSSTRRIAQPLVPAVPAPDARSGADALTWQPRSMGALAGEAWRLYLSHWRIFLLPVLLLEVPVLLLNITVLGWLDPGPSTLSSEWVLRFTVFALAHSVLTLVEAVGAFLLLAIVAVQIRALFAGGALGLGAALRNVLPRLRALVGGSALLLVSVGLLTVFGVFLSVVFSLVLTVLGADPNGGGLAGALSRSVADPEKLWQQLSLLVIVAGAAIFLIVKWSMMVQVVVLEDAPPVQSLRRSWALVRGAFWRTLLVLLASSLPITVLANATLVVEFFGLLPASGERAAILAASRALGLGLRLLILPWVMILVTLYYYDLRARREGPASGSAP